jgi:peroxiredoxin Q/BCP
LAKKPKTPTNYKITLGDKLPQFNLPATSGETLKSKEFAGKMLVLYFYPKDNTPGCTLEGQDFKKLYKKFKAFGCEVIGVSRDSIVSHEKFKEKCGFPFPLIADEDGALCKAFDVIQMKSLYGRKFEGIERSTFVVGKDGKLKGEWRKVKVAGHAADVLELVKSFA